MYVVNRPGVVQITIITMNLRIWSTGLTYFDRGYVSLPILAASSARMTAVVLLANDGDWVGQHLRIVSLLWISPKMSMFPARQKVLSYKIVGHWFVYIGCLTKWETRKWNRNRYFPKGPMCMEEYLKDTSFQNVYAFSIIWILTYVLFVQYWDQYANIGGGIVMLWSY